MGPAINFERNLKDNAVFIAARKLKKRSRREYQELDSICFISHKPFRDLMMTPVRPKDCAKAYIAILFANFRTLVTISMAYYLSLLAIYPIINLFKYDIVFSMIALFTWFTIKNYPLFIKYPNGWLPKRRKMSYTIYLIWRTVPGTVVISTLMPSLFNSLVSIGIHNMDLLISIILIAANIGVIVFLMHYARKHKNDYFRKLLLHCRSVIREFQYE